MKPALIWFAWGRLLPRVLIPSHPVILKVPWECMGINLIFWEMTARGLGEKFLISKYSVYI